MLPSVELIEAVRIILNLMVLRQWRILNVICSDSSVDWAEIGHEMDSYPRQLVKVPDDFWLELDIVPMLSGELSVRCPFWEQDESRSDLELEASAREIFPGIWKICVQSVHVP